MFLNESKHQFVTLPKVGSWPEADHEFERESLWAINAAIASKRPLLVAGEPGTGKSQLARAAAAALGRMPLSYVVNARTESRDLQYHYDALARLAEAQTATLADPGDKNRAQVLAGLHPRHFLEPGVLWWAFSWGTATTQQRQYKSGGQAPEKPDAAKLGDDTLVKADPAKGMVVLIDEIDKADSDVPNGLLETLGNGGFSVPYIKATVNATDPFPLVILTTNGDRELPPAFRRRCLVLKMELPTSKSKFVETLANRGKRRYRNQLAESQYEDIAARLWEDRQETLKTQINAPGQAEYFDMLEALVTFKAKGIDTQKALAMIHSFVFKKNMPGSAR